MYKLRFWINSDGDFSHINPLWNPDDNEHIFYFYKRKDAIKALNMVLTSLRDSISTSKGYDFSWIKKDCDLVMKIATKIETFYFDHSGGNQDIEISLCKTEKVEIESGFLFKDSDVLYDFWGVDQYNWEVLEQMDDIIDDEN